MLFDLSIPEQHNLDDPSVELDPQRTRQWLAELPMLDAGESLHRILNAQEALNQQKLDSKLRFRLLTAYQPFMLRLYDAAEPGKMLERHLSRQQQQSISGLLERLSIAMANGFKIVLKEWFAEGIHQSDPAVFARALRRASRQLGYSLINAYRCLRPVPAGTFHELHMLYRLARNFDMQDMYDPVRKSRSIASLAVFYQALMLLAICNASQAGTKQTDKLFRRLLRYADKVSFARGSSWQSAPSGLFIIDLVSDEAPQRCSEVELPLTATEPWLLDTRSLSRALHRKLSSMQAEQRNGHPDIEILKVLVPEPGR